MTAARVRPAEERTEECADCAGSGACEACDGYGHLPPVQGNGEGPECPVCEGTGNCPTCIDD